MQMNVNKICNKYANIYAEYVNKYATNMQNMQNNFPICRICNEQNVKHVVYAKYPWDFLFSIKNAFIVHNKNSFFVHENDAFRP